MSLIESLRKNRFLIFSSGLILLFLLFFNRIPNFIYILQSPFLKDAVITDFFTRTFLEHISFGFFFTTFIFFFLFGTRKFFDKNANWVIPFYFGIGATIIVSLYWEVLNAKGSIEYLEIAYDFLGIFLSYVYIKYLGDFEK